MKPFLLLFLLVACFCSKGFSQSETFDIATYTPPKNWKKEQKDFAISYSIVNQQKGIWCQLGIYPSINGSGNAENDFHSEWKSIIEKSYQPASTPTPESVTEDGWTSCTGASTFQWQGKETYVLLTTIEGYGKLMSITILMNSQDYMNDVEAFFTSMTLKKPQQVGAPAPVEKTATDAVQNTGAITVTGAAGNQGISISTTNFDDGWTAQPFADYVRVTKQNITVLLHYGIPFDDEMRNSNNLEALLFDKIILPRYSVSNIRKYDNGGPCYLCIQFFEADAVEKSTGKKCHLGFRIITNSGISRCIEIISPSAAAFQHAFPNQEKVEQMLNYNKFAVTLKDLIGTWELSSSAGVNMYNTTTGQYAGMNTSSSADKFIFNSNGTYESTHKGAYGMVGSLKFYQQEYKGALTVTNWDMVMTKRFEGKTSAFWAQFEAIRGGKVLHITDKQYSGSSFHVVKTN